MIAPGWTAEVCIAVTGAEACALSAANVFDVLVTLGDAAEHVVKLAFDSFLADAHSLLVEVFSDPSNLICCELIGGSTDRALEWLIKPSDRYLDMVSAIAGRFDVSCDFDAHGWPFLSFAGSTPANLAGRGGRASASPEGAA